MGSLLPALHAVWVVRIHKYKPPDAPRGGLYLWILTNHDAGQKAGGSRLLPAEILDQSVRP